MTSMAVTTLPMMPLSLFRATPDHAVAQKALAKRSLLLSGPYESEASFRWASKSPLSSGLYHVFICSGQIERAFMLLTEDYQKNKDQSNVAITHAKKVNGYIDRLKSDKSLTRIDIETTDPIFKFLQIQRLNVGDWCVQGKIELKPENGKYKLNISQLASLQESLGNFAANLTDTSGQQSLQLQKIAQSYGNFSNFMLSIQGILVELAKAQIQAFR